MKREEKVSTKHTPLVGKGQGSFKQVILSIEKSPTPGI